MSLDLGRLEKVRTLDNRVVQARCPACAEAGQDRIGEHLRIYPDGRFGCCVHPKDREHRKRIFALAGDKEPRPLTVRVSSSQPRVAATHSVAQSLTGLLRTLRTGNSESAANAALETAPDLFPEEEIRTLRTHLTIPYAYACAHTHMCIDNEGGVLSVLGREGAKAPQLELEKGVLSVPQRKAAVKPPQPAEKQERLPYLDEYGDMHIPFDSPERYHWWKGDDRLSPDQTLAEIKQRMNDEKRKAQNATSL